MTTHSWNSSYSRSNCPNRLPLFLLFFMPPEFFFPLPAFPVSYHSFSWSDLQRYIINPQPLLPRESVSNPCLMRDVRPRTGKLINSLSRALSCEVFYFTSPERSNQWYQRNAMYFWVDDEWHAGLTVKGPEFDSWTGQKWLKIRDEQRRNL